MKINLNDLAGGALDEKAQIAWRELAANIADPNTKATTARSMTITIKLVPDETRAIATSEVSVTTKTAPAKAVPTKFVIDQDNDGNAVMAELKANAKGQMMIDTDGNLADDKGRPIDANTGEIKDNKKVVSGNFR